MVPSACVRNEMTNSFTVEPNAMGLYSMKELPLKYGK